MSHITIGLTLPAKSFEQCVQLMAEDADLFAVTRRYGGWILADASEKGLISRVHSLLADRAISQILNPAYCAPKLSPSHGSTLILKVSLDGGADRMLCDVFTKYKSEKIFYRSIFDIGEALVFKNNPELLAIIKNKLRGEK